MPAGTMLRTTWEQVDATSLSDFSRVLTDNITSSQVILWLLGQMGGIVTRAGKTIVEPNIMEEAASVHWYSGFDPLDLTNTTGIFASEYAWKQLAGTCQLSGIERFQNSGPNGIIDLWNAKGQQLAISMRKAVNRAIPADGSADLGKALVGLQAAIPFDASAGVYGTLDRATNPNWRSFYPIAVTPAHVTMDMNGTAVPGADINDATVAGNTTLGVRNLFNGIRASIVVTTAGGDSPDLSVMPQTPYLQLLFGLETFQQILRGVDREDQALANAGFKNIIYMGVPQVWDVDMLPNTPGTGSATTGYGVVTLNLNYMKCVFGEGYEFVFSDPIEPNNQDAISMKCLAYLNLVFSNLRRHARVNYTGN